MTTAKRLAEIRANVLNSLDELGDFNCQECGISAATRRYLLDLIAEQTAEIERLRGETFRLRSCIEFGITEEEQTKRAESAIKKVKERAAKEGRIPYGHGVVDQ